MTIEGVSSSDSDASIESFFAEWMPDADRKVVDWFLAHKDEAFLFMRITDDLAEIESPREIKQFLSEEIEALGLIRERHFPTETSEPAPEPSKGSVNLPKEVLAFAREGIWFDGKFYSYQQIAQRAGLEKVFSPQHSPQPDWPPNICDPLHPVMNDQIGASAGSLPATEGSASRRFVLPGETKPGFSINWNNGIATSFEEAVEHGKYLQQWAQGLMVDGVYNATNTKVVDLLEVFVLNYSGFSPNTGNLIRENMLNYYEKYKDQPGMKYLQICHSKGAIDVCNVLESLPEAVRNKVIVVALAPGKVVSRKLCYNSYNYASVKDPVPKGEVLYASFLSSEENRDGIEEVMSRYQELQLLDPHSEEQGWGHDFQNPTFRELLKTHIEKYIQSNGSFN